MADVGKETHWLEVKIDCNGDLAEALAEVLGRFVLNGVVIGNKTRLKPNTQDNEPTDELQISGYLDVDDQLEDKKHRLEEALWHLGQIMPVPEPVYTLIHDEDWMEAWKKHYQPIAIGERLLIMPAWMTPAKDDARIVIRINPAMAFGTGTHPTTKLCLRLLEHHLVPGDTVMDIGCGSGILAIAALKLGSAHALAVDIDSQAITSTLENAELNDIAPGDLEVGEGSVEEILTGRFTMQTAPQVLVNILAPVIIRLFGQGLGSLVSQGGKVLLSGLLENQEGDVLSTAEKAGFTPIERLAEADWVSMAMVKNEP